jgi:serine phosphatase RsbU (regulator of sigma subunit)/anti-sigma regulatory factor (Ser/Thr protein kinase)
MFGRHRRRISIDAERRGAMIEHLPQPAPTRSERPALSLKFEAKLDLVEGILAVVQDWAERQEIPRDDGLSLRLVLEELIVNLCRHASSPAGSVRTTLHLEYWPHPNRPDSGAPDGHGLVRITLRDNGKPFNPLQFSPQPVAGITDTPIGGRGLTLVHLLTTGAAYRRAGGENVLVVDLSVDGRATLGDGENGTGPLAPEVCGLCDSLRRHWSGNLALRQTILFTLCSALLIWSAMVVYTVEVDRERSDAATALAMAAMHNQSDISSDFVGRVGGAVDQLVEGLRTMPDLPQLIANDGLATQLESNAQLRSLLAELPVAGLAVGHAGTTRLYSLKDGALTSSVMTPDLTPLVPPSGEAPGWRGIYTPVDNGGRHAAMLYGARLLPNGSAADGWIGTIITMPWIAETLQEIGAFQNSVPFFVGESGQYIIHPVGRQLGEGPQSLSDEARQFAAPGLVSIEKKILAGEKGLIQLRPALGSDETPWPLPWSGPTSVAFHPLSQPGWYLGLLISSTELGDAPQDLPLSLLLMAVLGPLAVGCTTWVVTSRSLKPVRDLASALERFGGGDLDAPFPVAPYPDEIGAMLTTFERVRVTLRASFRNLVKTAAAQERLVNELALARDIQTSMLPAVFPRLPWLAVHAGIDMCSEVCGDLYDCFLPSADDPSRLCCVVGDVCGKGVPAALVMSRVLSLSRAFLMDGLAPDETLYRVNEALLRSNSSMMFVTLLVGILEADGRFVWASAGHPPPLVGPRPDGSGPGDGPAWSGDLVLGVRGQQRYSTFELRLEAGQSMLLYTDGADEALGPPGDGAQAEAPQLELYGDARLARSFATACQVADPAAIVARISADLAAHMAGQPTADDISLMAVTYFGPTRAISSHSSDGDIKDA